MNLSPLLLSHSGKLGGAERWLIDVSQALANAGADPTVAGPVGPLQHKIADLGLAYVPIPVPWWAATRVRGLARCWSFAPFAIGPFLTLVNLVRQHTLVLSNTSVIGIGELAAWRAGVPHVWAIHELRRSFRYAVGEAGLRWAMHRSSTVILNSRTTERSWKTTLGATRRCVIRQPVEPGDKRWQRKSRRRFRILTLAAVDPVKNIEFAISTLGEIVRTGLDAELNVVGPQTPRYVSILMALAAHEGVDDRVLFSGQVDDASMPLADANVLLHPCGKESYGRVLAEALVVGTPIVARSGGASTELLEAGRLGFLVDTPRAAGTRILQLANQPEFAERLSMLGATRTSQLQDRQTFTKSLLAALSTANSRSHPRPVG